MEYVYDVEFSFLGIAVDAGAERFDFCLCELVDHDGFEVLADLFVPLAAEGVLAVEGVVECLSVVFQFVSNCLSDLVIQPLVVLRKDWKPQGMDGEVDEIEAGEVGTTDFETVIGVR